MDILHCRAVELGIGPNKFMRNLTKCYAKRFPESPKNVSEIVEYFSHPTITSTTGQTLRGENERTTQLFKHDYTFCLFASDDVIDIMGTISPNHRLIFCDGTFYVVPYGDFSQLLILSIDIQGKVSCHFLV